METVLSSMEVDEMTNCSLRWLPRLIIAIAVLDIGFTLALETPFREIAEAGVVDSVAGHGDRESAFWHLVAGTFLFGLGELSRWAVRETGRVPARLGSWLIGVGVAGIVLMPASGFWLVAALGAFAVLSSARDARRSMPASRPWPSGDLASAKRR